MESEIDLEKLKQRFHHLNIKGTYHGLDTKELEEYNDLQFMLYPPVRRTGTTTRIIDRCIQELFNNHITIARDIKMIGKTQQQQHQIDLEVLRLIVKRMQNEHPNVKLIINKERLTIEI